MVIKAYLLTEEETICDIKTQYLLEIKKSLGSDTYTTRLCLFENQLKALHVGCGYPSVKEAVKWTLSIYFPHSKIKLSNDML